MQSLCLQFQLRGLTDSIPSAGKHFFTGEKDLHSDQSRSCLSRMNSRVLESTLRTTNNLLERLHASFFFYLFLGVNNFLKIGNYLPLAIIISAALMFGGLGEWVGAGWTLGTSSPGSDEKQDVVEKLRWVPRRRPVLTPILIMLSTHLTGVILFYTITGSSFAAYQTVSTSLSLCGWMRVFD